MLVKDPITSKLYVSVQEAMLDIQCFVAAGDCSICPASILNNGRGISCYDFAELYPGEAAKLLGYKIVHG